MRPIPRILRYILFSLLTAAMITCAPAKKNTVYRKKKANSSINASMLGRNKYYFSSGYQKKLDKQFRK